MEEKNSKANKSLQIDQSWEVKKTISKNKLEKRNTK